MVVSKSSSTLRCRPGLGGGQPVALDAAQLLALHNQVDPQHLVDGL